MTVEEELSNLKKEMKSMKKEFDIETANIKINYLGSLVIVLSYVFFNQINGLNIFGKTFSAVELTYIITPIVMIFLWKECLTYGQYLSRKILFRLK